MLGGHQPRLHAARLGLAAGVPLRGLEDVVKRAKMIEVYRHGKLLAVIRRSDRHRLLPQASGKWWPHSAAPFAPWSWRWVE